MEQVRTFEKEYIYFIQTANLLQETSYQLFFVHRQSHSQCIGTSSSRSRPTLRGMKGDGLSSIARLFRLPSTNFTSWQVRPSKVLIKTRDILHNIKLWAAHSGLACDNLVLPKFIPPARSQ